MRILSIVFSYWKSTLNLLGHVLSSHGVAYCQVDGDTSYADRSITFRRFREEASVQVLLMTMGIGAVG